MSVKPYLKSLFLPGLVWLSGLVFFSVSGCSNMVTQPDKTPSNNTPEWVLGDVKEGAVCSTDKGVYARSEAYLMAINQCLIQLADKQISGASQQTKEVMVQRTAMGETVKTSGSSNQAFQVTTGENNLSIKYEILGKYYNAAIEKVYVWVKLTS